MKNTKALCQTAVVAALYVALTTLNPLSWGAVQFRVANMLCALPFGGACTQAAMDRLAEAIAPLQPDFLVGMGGGKAIESWGFCGKRLSSPCPWLCSSVWSCL